MNRKFQVHINNIFWICNKKKKKYRQVATISTPKFDSLPSFYLKVGCEIVFDGITSNDDYTLAVWWQRQVF